MKEKDRQFFNKDALNFQGKGIMRSKSELKRRQLKEKSKYMAPFIRKKLFEIMKKIQEYGI